MKSSLKVKFEMKKIRIACKTYILLDPHKIKALSSVTECDLVLWDVLKPFGRKVLKLSLQNSKYKKRGIIFHESFLTQFLYD
jgi:hypothetical protein